MIRKGLGWVRDLRSGKDFRFTAPKTTDGTKISLPSEITLSTPPIVDQKTSNSCVGNSCASLFRYSLKRLGYPEFQPSRLFIYWFARHVPRLGWENEDEGAMPRDAMQSMISNGVIPEEDWPFDLSKVNERPPQTLLAKAKAKRIVEGRYVRMLANDDLYHLKFSISQHLPFLIGVDVYSSFYDTGSDGMVPMPQTSETYEGGHAMFVNGYSNSLRRFRAVNSWGTDWGQNGTCWLPYEYITNAGLAGDFWRIEAIT